MRWRGSIAQQYYQLALDRFYRQSPLIWRTLEMGELARFITEDTVVTYFDRLVRASSQKARVSSEVAKRYQNFNRPDLAKGVIERAYVAAYLESIVMSRMMLKVMSELAPEERSQITAQLELAELTYRAALLDMRDTYKSIQNEVNYFGFSPEYIPIPALEPEDISSFDKTFAFALQRMEVAREKEEEALADTRSFDIDKESFQSELIKLRDLYENQLAGLCGTFLADDGQHYPAIAAYSHLSDNTRLLGNPCGFVGNGQIHEAVARLEMRAAELKSVMLSQENTFKKMEIQKEVTEEQCQARENIQELVREKINEKFNSENEDIQANLDKRDELIRSFMEDENSAIKDALAKKNLKMQESTDIINSLVESKRGEISNISFNTQGQTANLEDEIRSSQRDINDAQRSYDTAMDVASTLQVEVGTSTDAAGALAAAAAMGIADGILTNVTEKYEKRIDEKQSKISELTRLGAKSASTIEIELEVEQRQDELDLQFELSGIDAALDERLKAIDADRQNELQRLEAELGQQLRELDKQLDIDLRDLNVTLECDLADINSKATIEELWLRIAELDLEVFQAVRGIKLAVSEIQEMFNQASRTISEMKEHEQLTINVETARNNPNVRIYRNDALINADRTFWNAMQEAYKATKVYEYYTSQSYDRLQNLFLVRTVSHGDFNLESYLGELQDSFVEFEEKFGNPDTRVAIVSLRDDMFAIPYLDEQGGALTQAERVARLQGMLNDVVLLDGNGYLSIPFSTTLASLSPLTRNHKIVHIEAEIIGTSVGDSIGRVYVRQDGTGLVHTVSDEKQYLAFPEITGVVNPLFNGQKVHEPEVYQNRRLLDRPVVNTHWALVVNRKDEVANQDIDLGSLTDIRLYIYYTDFTTI